jgi:hypothetical protein
VGLGIPWQWVLSIPHTTGLGYTSPLAVASDHYWSSLGAKVPLLLGADPSNSSKRP